jgi:hypothetical protein
MTKFTTTARVLTYWWIRGIDTNLGGGTALGAWNAAKRYASEYPATV